MHFDETPPIPELAAVVQSVWTLEADAREIAGHLEPVLPDGCPELVMQFGDPFEQLNADGSSTVQAPILFAGQLTRQLTLRPSGRAAVLGIRFRPESAAAVLHMPQRELLGATLGVDTLDAALFRPLRAIRDASRSPREAAILVQTALAARLDSAWCDPMTRDAVAAIRRRSGRDSIDALAKRLGITRRRLERRFDTHVGIPPKRLARIVRFQHALRLLRRAGAGTITALDSGYADQSHFIREFTDIAGCSPGAHLVRQAELCGFFTERRVQV